VRRTINYLGRFLFTGGLLLLLFVAYQLWGTGIFTARAQEQLKKDFNKELQAQQHEDDPLVQSTTTLGSTVPHKPSTTTTVGRRTHLPPAPPIPGDGEVEGIIQIPKIGLDIHFVEGVSLEDLKKGPGHYPLTPLPGQFGNAAIAGHRTTYLHPFFRINELGKGDKILVTTLSGLFTYSVTEQLVVNPTDLFVLDPPSDPKVAELTLTACHPRYSASHRIVIHAVLVPNESAKPRTPPPIPAGSVKGKRAHQSLEDGLSGDTRTVTPTIFFGIFWALVALAWWWAFRRWRHPVTWFTGVLPFLVALFVFYYFLERALPPGI
jgi:sortase A